MTERRAATASASFTPAAAAYTAGDVMDVAQEFVNIAPMWGGPIMIVSCSLLISHTALVASEGAYRLHIYNVTPPSAHADNDAWDLPAGDRSAYLGYVDLGTPVDIGSSLWVETHSINKQIMTLGSAGGGNIWGELVTNAGITPTAAARTVTLHAIW